MPVLPSQSSTGQRRQRNRSDKVHPTASTTSPLPHWKRVKKPFKSFEEANSAYWDSFSNLWLTQSALTELDRRVTRLGQNSPGRRSGLRSGKLATFATQTKRFARQCGLDLRYLRGYSAQGVAKSAIPLTESTAQMAPGMTAYDRMFEQHLFDHGIYLNNYTIMPHNWDEIQQMIAQPRPSLSPSTFSDQAFRSFQQESGLASNESLVRDLFPRILGEGADICSSGKFSFNNLEALTDGTIVDASPEICDGARPGQVDPRIRAALGSFIIPFVQPHFPAVPNFFVELKGPKGDMTVAKLQACYDGAVGARAIHKLRSFGVEDPNTVYDNNAYTITSTYQDGILRLYTCHPTKSTVPRNPPEYHMTLLHVFAINGSPDMSRQGATAIRNAREWAKQKRDEFVAAAKDRI